MLASLYPEKGNIVTQIIVKDIKDKVGLTQKELKECEFKTTPQGYTWTEEKAPIVDIKLTEAEFNLLSEQVKELDKESKITQELLPVCLLIKKSAEKEYKQEVATK